jgi:predicted Zn-dependent protease with MMP-like domain
MNERIQQLAEQAREFATTRHPVSNIVLSVNSEKFEEKFAELIVLKCADIADEYDGVGSTIVSRIQKHFGVEE